jgi:protein-disulfide isomerase
MKKTLLIIAGVLIVGAGIGAYAWQYNMSQQPQDDAALPSPQPTTASDTPQQPNPTPPAQVDANALIIGNVDAPLTIIEYGDFQCPICKSFFDKTEAQLIKDYVDTGKAKIEFRVETHIGAESVAAGEAAYCANDQNKFRDYHNALYTRQKGTNAGTFSSANLKKIALDLKLNTTTFNSCLDTGKYKTTVTNSHAEATKRISGTPTFFIGDQKIVGAQPYSIFKPVIDAQLK